MNFQFTSGPVRGPQPFSDEEIQTITTAIQKLKEACEARPESLEVVSTLVKGPTGMECEVTIYEDGVADSCVRIHRDMYSDKVVFTAAYGTTGAQ